MKDGLIDGPMDHIFIMFWFPDLELGYLCAKFGENWWKMWVLEWAQILDRNALNKVRCPHK